jgi:hypothetical protein
MIWQCHHLLQSEDGCFSRTHAFRTDYDGNLSSAPLMPFKISMNVHEWRHNLRDFFRREFTRPEDILPALAGLIDIWQRYTNDYLVLGLSLEDLPIHLFWFSGPSFSIIDRVPGQPSWCWTSVPQRDRAIIQHASLDYTGRATTVGKQLSQPSIYSGKAAFCFATQVCRAFTMASAGDKGAFYQAMPYLLDNEEERSTGD